MAATSTIKKTTNLKHHGANGAANAKRTDDVGGAAIGFVDPNKNMALKRELPVLEGYKTLADQKEKLDKAADARIDEIETELTNLYSARGKTVVFMVSDDATGEKIQRGHASASKASRSGILGFSNMERVERAIGKATILATGRTKLKASNAKARKATEKLAAARRGTFADEIMALVGKRPMTMHELIEATGKASTKIANTLSSLRDQKRISRRGKRGSFKYVAKV